MTATRRLAAILSRRCSGIFAADRRRTKKGRTSGSRHFLPTRRSESQGASRAHRKEHRRRNAGRVREHRGCGALCRRDPAGMNDCNTDIPANKRISFRMGINLGDVIVEPDDIFGDGVNIAARLEALAEPGGICISRTVHDHISDKTSHIRSRTSGSKASRTLLVRCTSIAFGLTRSPKL